MLHFKKKSFGEEGQTIIEAVVALASIMLTLAAITVAITTSVSNSEFIKNQSQASKYAQQGMESIRNLRNTDPTTFETLTGILCLNEDGTFTVDGCQGQVNVDSRFRRTAEFTPDPTCGQNETNSEYGIRVTVSVNWASGKCSEEDRFCHNSELVSCFATGSNTSGQL